MVCFRLLFLSGDGIGPEILVQVARLVSVINRETDLCLEIEHALIGGAALDAEGTPLHDRTLSLAKSADAVLLGAVGGPRWDDFPFEKKPERGLLTLRKEMRLFANLRPAFCFPSLSDASTLKREVVSGLDVLIVRELIGGIYFGVPRGISDLPDGRRRGVNTHVYTSDEVIRVARVAFALARRRKKRVVSCEKSNVMESGLLWRQEVSKVQAREFPDLELTHMYADNCAMQLVRAPKQFDVIVTDNLFGDILSDVSAMLTGSLGMLPSASLGELDVGSYKRWGLYEPVHGSAPDIAGKNLANPLAAVLSFGMLLRYSLQQEALADKLERSVETVLARGVRTRDIALPHMRAVGTQEVGTALEEEFRLRLQR